MNKFEELNAINVNDKVEQKNGLNYLSWAWAWAEVKKKCPDATYKILRDECGLPYFKEEGVGYMCMTEVTIEGETLMMWLPVMDYRNKSIMQPTTFDINKTIMRCLTKNLAMFGLGLYIYAGEDLPESEETQTEKPKKKVDKQDAEEHIDEYREALKGLLETLKKMGAYDEFWEEVKTMFSIESVDDLDANGVVEVGKLTRKRVIEEAKRKEKQGE